MAVAMLRMSVLSVCIFMTLSNAVKPSVVRNLKINEFGKNNVKNNLRVIRMINSIGFLMCIKECQLVFPCGAVNYKQDSLQCELITEGALETELVASAGWRYIPKSEMHGIFQSPQSCGFNARYVEFKKNHARCFPLSPMDLSFVDCRYTPGPGVYFININEDTRIQARCQGEWMNLLIHKKLEILSINNVFQQRTVGSGVSFAKNWLEYKQGFGNPDGDHWLGNQNLYLYTLQGPSEMRIELETSTSPFFAEYNTLAIGNEQSNYILTVYGYTGTAGDAFNDAALTLHRTNGKEFTTHDRDNDMWSDGNCAAEPNTWGIAWWYGYCSTGALNQFRWMPLSNTVTIRATKMLVRRKQ